jgi:hypothetical protein
MRGESILSVGRVCGEGVERFGRAEVLCNPIFPLSFPQHVHELDADSRGLCGVKRFEAQHWPRHPFHRTMILFHQIIQI